MRPSSVAVDIMVHTEARGASAGEEQKPITPRTKTKRIQGTTARYRLRLIPELPATSAHDEGEVLRCLALFLSLTTRMISTKNSKVVEMLEPNGDSEPNWLEWSSSQLFRYSYAPPSEERRQLDSGDEVRMFRNVDSSSEVYLEAR